MCSESIPILEEGSRGDEVVDLQTQLFQLGYADLTRPSEVFDAGTTQAVKCFQRDLDLPITGVADEVTQAHLERHLTSPGGWVAQAAQLARRLLDLEGTRLVFRDDGVKGELERAATRRTIPHPCDQVGVYLHPFLLQTLLEVSERSCFELSVLRSAHGKYQMLDDLSVCDVPDATTSAHYLGHGADFYRLGPSLDRLVARGDGDEAWWAVQEPVIRPYWEAEVAMPPGYWIVFSEGLKSTYRGIHHGIRFFSNPRHVDHLHVGLNMNVPRL